MPIGWVKGQRRTGEWPLLLIPLMEIWLINIGQTLIGVGGTIPFSGVSLVAATWFPPNQRATATSIASTFAYLGVARLLHHSNTGQFGLNETNLTDAVDLSSQSEGIMRLIGRCSGLLALLVLVYFPARPPRPPSRTAALPRTEFRKGIPALLRNKRFCQLAVAYCLPIGAYGGFGGIMDIDLNPTGISQAGIMLMTTAGWIGFYSTIGGCVSALVFSRLADMFMRRLKVFLLALFVGAAASCVWFCLLVLKYIPFHLPSVYASSVLIGVCINGAIPLFYEAACEVSYPVAEGVTTGMLALLNNIVGIIFFALLLVPGIGVVWMNWVLLSCVLAAIPVLLTLKQHYARIDIDTEIHVPDPTHPTIPTTPTPPQPPSPPTL
ncbi:hypothetical protein BaRGS_00013121 [Batillaria attramentaria]|uniref:Uncharacterized protein n=1 Tax=Batillaria attramentaria TaxID=370345 RepID=A0ABD0L7W5_9CAEN